MSLTVAQSLTRIRDMLDEPTAAQWTDQQLRRWINDALDDASRTTLAIADNVSITSVAGQAEYTVTAAVLQINMAYWTDGSGNLAPLMPQQWENADNVWGISQNQQSSQPMMFTTWGFAPNLKLKLYPVPNVSSRTILLKVARLATHVSESGASDSTVIDFPEAWLDAITSYVEYNALRKARDPRWQEAKQEYQEKRDNLGMHDYMSVAREIVYDPGVIGGVPRWIADPRL